LQLLCFVMCSNIKEEWTTKAFTKALLPTNIQMIVATFLMFEEIMTDELNVQPFICKVKRLKGLL